MCMSAILTSGAFFIIFASNRNNMLISKEYDFSDCRHNPRLKTFVEDIKAAIPEFAKYDGEEDEHVFAYVVALYDKNSPLWVKVPEYFERKVRAAEICHLPRSNTGGFSEFTRAVLEGQDKKVNALVIAYLADLGDMDYMMLINEIMMFHSITNEVLGGSTKKDTYATMQSLSDNIKGRTRAVFGSGERDELAKIRILLYESAERDRRRLNPEAIVAMLDKDGDFPGDWGRYGSKYKPEPLKFHTDAE